MVVGPNYNGPAGWTDPCEGVDCDLNGLGFDAGSVRDEAVADLVDSLSQTLKVTVADPTSTYCVPQSIFPEPNG